MEHNIYLNEIAVKLKYRMSSGGDYLWKCYGDDCRIMDFGDDDDNFHVSVMFDALSLEAREISGYGDAFLEGDNVPWRWIHPDYYESYVLEANSKNIVPNKAWDDVLYVTVDKDEVLRILSLVKIKR